jgi:membrane-associated protein
MLSITDLINFILHIDIYVGAIIQSYGVLTYLILFLIIFLETGIVVTPFLPGDSLIFVAGAFSAQGYLNPFLLFFVLAIAAILGDSFNYWIGKFFGEQVSNWKFVKKEYLQRTEKFYELHGGKTIILARFIPIIRTFAPFVAGIGKMDYPRFLSFNVVGGIIWTALFTFGGYFFGGISFIKENLGMATLIIIFVSLIPVLIELIREKLKSKR